MDLVTEKFKQKIAAVFYLNSRKFNQTRILRSEESVYNYLWTKGWELGLWPRWKWLSPLTLSLYNESVFVTGDFASEMPCVKADIHCSPKEFQCVRSNLLGSNACPWMKIISPNSIQNECENGMRSMDSLPAKSDECKFVTDTMECTSISSPGKTIYRVAQISLFWQVHSWQVLEENREGRTKQNKTKPFIIHSRLWLSWVSFNAKNFFKRTT